MSDAADASRQDGATPPSPPRSEGGPNWSRRLVVGAVVLAAAIILFLVAAQVVPRWWSHRVGDQVDQSTAQGIDIGLFYGMVFTLVPLLILWLTFRRRRSWRVRLVGIAAAVLLAAPNLMTLGIVAGTSSGAHAGERTLDVEAPYFRGASLIGAIAAVGVALAIIGLVQSRRRSRDRESALRSELRARDEESAKRPPERP